MGKKIAVFLLLSNMAFAQSVSQKLETATKSFQNSEMGKASTLSVYVVEESGNVVYDYQADRGLSTASTQKIFTAAAALEVLGNNYTYTTTASYSGSIANNILKGDIYISSNGDPTLGSWRYDDRYKPEAFLQNLVNAVKKSGINKISGDLVIDDSYFDYQTIPGGWPWDDLGNYYGAGIWGLNWRENQFDLIVYKGKIRRISYPLVNVRWLNDVKVGGTNDESIIFTAPRSEVALINGYIPAKNSYTVSGSTPNPPLQLGVEIKKNLNSAGIEIEGNVVTTSQLELEKKEPKNTSNNKVFFTHSSPTLDQIVYWFLKKSVNLYGEALLKTIGKQKTKNSDFISSVAYLKDFWKSKGIDEYSINFADGSGLSPQNYVSAKAEVLALLYAKKQAWFPQYYAGFPDQDNGMKMKSGTLRNVKSYAGYYTSSDGKKYVFSVILNNYQGNTQYELFKILNVLK